MNTKQNDGAADMPERVVPVDLGVNWSAGAPAPVLLMDEGRAMLLFELAVDSEEGFQTGVIEWIGCTATTFGFPNDDVQHGHRLWRESTTPPPYYEAVEVLGSSWIAELARIEREHPAAGREPFSGSRHFVLLFHDSTFECVARDLKVTRSKSTVEEALIDLAGEFSRLRGGSTPIWPV